MNQQTPHRIEPGYYRARAISGTEQYATGANGTDQIALDFDVPALGRTLRVFFYCTDAAAPYAVEKLRACGWRGDDITRLVGLGEREVDLQVKYEMYKGAEKMKVDVAASGGGNAQLEGQMDDRAKRAFAARMRPLLGGAPTTEGQRPPSPPGPPRAGFGGQRQAPPPGVDADDPIPF